MLQIIERLRIIAPEQPRAALNEALDQYIAGDITMLAYRCALPRQALMPSPHTDPLVQLHMLLDAMGVPISPPPR